MEESRLVVVDIEREYGEGVTIRGDCPQKGICAHLKWFLCPGWTVDQEPCENLDQDRSSFKEGFGHASLPEVVIYCKGE